MAGESTAAWRQFIENLDARGLQQPVLVTIDGAPGLEAAVTALWGEDLPTQRCSLHKHRNLLAHAPQRLHEELNGDYRDMIYAPTAAQVQERRTALLRKWRLKCRAVADSLQEAGERLSFIRLHPGLVESGAHHQRHRTTQQGVPPPHQNPDPPPLCRDRAHALLSIAGIRTDPDAQGAWLGTPSPTHPALHP